MTGTSTGRFEGAIVLVTGGGSGIGAAAVRQFDREGCAAVHVADVDVEGARYPHYAASKAGVHALAQAVAKEAAAFGVRVNVVAPGPVDTPMAARTPVAVRQAMAATGPVGYASPDELADNILYLASPGASNVVGAVLLSNGGRFTV